MSRSALRLRAPRPSRPRPSLDDVQQRVAEWPVGAGNLMVVGAPGSGKTTTAMAAFEHRLEVQGGSVLLLVPSRRAAARVRDEVSARLRRTVAGLSIRTPASFAFSVLRARATALGEPAPTLITGGEQDAILAELLAGHRLGLGRVPTWPASVPPETRALRAFRAELRDLLMRAAEAGLDAEDLARLGREEGRAEWVAAADVLREYQEVLRLGSITPDRGWRYDAATIVDRAVDALLSWPDDLPGVPRPQCATVLVDDHQDTTLATARLVHALHDAGTEILLFGDADAGVQGYRGGTPSLVQAATADAGRLGGFSARQVALPHVWRQTPDLRAVTSAVTSRIGASGGAAHRRAHAAAPVPIGDDVPPAGVATAVLRTRAQEGAMIARVLREEHLHHGTDYAAMAVVTRSAGQAGALRRSLAAAGVPVSADAGEYALRDAPAVRPVLQAAEVVLRGARGGDSEADILTGDVVTDLLTSPLAGGDRLDAVSMRGLRRALRARAAAADDHRPIDVLLVEAVAEPDAAADLPPRARGALRRIATVLVRGRDAARDARVTAESLLWALWSAADVAEPWRRTALTGGPGADRADRDLDAMLTLFRTAEQYTDRNPAAGPEEFLRHVLTQDLPADTLAPRGGREHAVEVVTATGAAGSEWDVVVVAGVQEDVWPDLRIRGSLLGSADLAQRTAGRSVGSGVDTAVARHEVLQDELRAFAVAVSRARRRVLVTAVRDGELAPSPFVDLVDDGAARDGDAARDEDPGPEEDPVRPFHDVPVPLDLRGLVARLRAELPDGADAAAAAGLLADLASAGVQGADPRGWPAALAESSSAPLWGEGKPVELSPSAIETAQHCALRWALERVGGRPAAAAEQSLGTLIHEIAAALPHGSHAELIAELHRRLPELGLGAGWVGRTRREQAEEIVRRLAAYVESRPGPVDVEVAVGADVAGVRVTGRADRVEHAADGSVRIVDLKTGKSPKSVERAATDPQLAAYQAAVRNGALGGGVQPGGAALVYLGLNREAAQRHQPPLTDAWAEEMIAEVASAVGGGAFDATPGEACRTCPVSTSCPAVPDGERVAW